MISDERVTRDAPLHALIDRPTSAGHDRKRTLLSNIHDALAGGELEVAGDLVAQLRRLHSGDEDTRRAELHLERARARPLLNKLCGPDDRVRLAATGVELEELPLKLVHRVLIEHVDGQTSSGDLLDATGLAPLEFAEALRDLALFGVVTFVRPKVSTKPPSSRRRKN